MSNNKIAGVYTHINQWCWKGGEGLLDWSPAIINLGAQSNEVICYMNTFKSQKNALGAPLYY